MSSAQNILLNSASRAALDSAQRRLDEVVEGADRDQLATLADELFAFVSLLDREPGLRRAATDTSTQPEARERLVRGLLEGKLGESALRLVVTVVTERWSTARDLVDGVERLGRLSLLILGEREGRLDAVEDELFRLGRIVAAQPELDRLLSDPTGDEAGRRQLLGGLIGGKVDDITAKLAEQMVSRLKGRHAEDGLSELADLAAARRQRSVAHVRSAVALDEQRQQRLADALERMYSRPIALHLEVDPDVLGGMVIHIDDEVIDGTIAGRLASVRRELAR